MQTNHSCQNHSRYSCRCVKYLSSILRPQLITTINITELQTQLIFNDNQKLYIPSQHQLHLDRKQKQNSSIDVKLLKHAQHGLQCRLLCTAQPHRRDHLNYINLYLQHEQLHLHRQVQISKSMQHQQFTYSTAKLKQNLVMLFMR